MKLLLLVVGNQYSEFCSKHAMYVKLYLLKMQAEREAKVSEKHESIAHGGKKSEDNYQR